MTTTQSVPFIEYWDALDAALLKFFRIGTWDAGIEADVIAAAQEEGNTPEDFVLRFGEKCGLILVTEWGW